MYKIEARQWMEYEQPIVIHDPANDVFAITATLALELNTAGTLKFSLPSDDTVAQWLRTNILNDDWYICVYRDTDILWIGRTIRVDNDRINGTQEVECEGLLAMLNDAVASPYSFNGTPSDYISHICSDISAQMRVNVGVGNVTVQDPNNYIVRSNSDYSNAWDELSSKTAGSSLGGYIFARWDNQNNEILIDWLASPGSIGTQYLRYRSNVLTLADKLDGSELYTGILPYGARTEEGDPPVYVNLIGYSGTIPSGFEIDSTSGVIYKTTLKNTYGKCSVPVHFEDCTTVNGLLNAAKKYLNDSSIVNTFEAAAIDLYFVDNTNEPFKLGNMYNIQVPGVNQALTIVKLSEDLLHPESSSYTFGKLPKNNISSAVSGGGGIGGGDNHPYLYRKVTSSSVHSDEDNKFVWLSTLNESDVSVMTQSTGEPNIYNKNGENHTGRFGYFGIKQWSYYPGTSTTEPPQSIMMLGASSISCGCDSAHIDAISGSQQLGYTGHIDINTLAINVTGAGQEDAKIRSDGGFWLKGNSVPRDSQDEEIPIPAIYSNGANIWIGASQSAAAHHLGGLCISSGYNESTSKGNDSIYISIPNSANDGSSNYKVWHAGNLKTGTIVEKAASNASRASGSNINFNNVSLAAGTWLVVACFGFGSNTSGVRAGKLTTTSADTSTLTEGQATLSPPSGAMRFTVSRIFSLSATTTVYAVGYQNSGSSINGQASIKAVRII